MFLQILLRTFLIFVPQTAKPASQRQSSTTDTLSHNNEVPGAPTTAARLQGNIPDSVKPAISQPASNYGYIRELQANIKGLQQKVRRLKTKLEDTETRIRKDKFTVKDQELLQCIKAAEALLKHEHAEHYEHVFTRLAKAILDEKLRIDSIELVYICQLSRNLSQTYTNQFRCSDIFMRFCSALIKLQSGRAVLKLLRAGSPKDESTSAELVKDTQVNFHFPSENSINDWNKRHDVDPDFTLGVSEPTIAHVQKETEGILRIGADATDCHGTPRFISGGRFEQGDVFFPGSGYDSASLEAEYRRLVQNVEKYAVEPSSIECATASEKEGFLAGCKKISTFLKERLESMSNNIDTLSEKLSDSRAEYQRRQTVRAADKKAAVKADGPKEKTKAKTKVQGQQASEKIVS